MSETATHERLHIGPPPADYKGGAVTVRYQPADGEPADDLKTLPSLDHALEFAQTCVERGFLQGDLSFRPANQEPPALEQIIDAEERAYAEESIAMAQGQEIDDPTPASPATPPLTLSEDELAAIDAQKNNPEPTLTYQIERIPPNAPTKVEHQGKTLAQSRELFASMRCRGGAILRIRDSNGAVIDEKHAALAAVEEELPDPAPQDEGAEQEEQPEDPIVDSTGQTALIDPIDYETEELQLPRVDGQPVDRIAFAFTGQIMLDRSDPADVKLFRKLTLGHDVTLQIEGVCAGYAGKGNTNRDGDLDVIVATRRIKINTIYLPAGEAA